MHPAKHRLLCTLLVLCAAALSSACTAPETPRAPRGGITPPYLGPDLTRGAATQAAASPGAPQTLAPASLELPTVGQAAATISRAILPPGTTGAPTMVIATLPPPLADVNFPSQTIAYPDGWPADLRYPDPFVLVEATMGVSPHGVKGWAAKLVYHGDPQSAADLLTAFLSSKGWQPIERTALDTPGYLLVFQKGDQQHPGTFIIDSDTQQQGYLKIIATAFE